MKLINIITIAAFSLLAHLDINGQKINFSEVKSEKDWTDLLSRAEALDKPVFLDIYATWCGPCKQLDNLVFSDSSVAGFFNESFLNLKLDGESEFGRVLVREFRLGGYPTMYFLAADKFMYSNLVGFRTADYLLSYGKKVDTYKGKLREYAKMMDEGALKDPYLEEYTDILTELDNKNKLAEISRLFVSSLTPGDVLKPENKNLIISADFTFESELFQSVLKQSEELSDIWSAEDYDRYLEKVFQEALFRAAASGDTELRDRLARELIPVFFRNTPESLIYGEFLTRKLFHAAGGNWDEYIAEVERYYWNDLDENYEFLVQEVYQILQNQYSSAELYSASAKWIGMIPVEQRNFMAYYLGAICYTYLENYDNAEKMIMEAEKLATADEMDSIERLKVFVKELQVD